MTAKIACPSCTERLGKLTETPASFRDCLRCGKRLPPPPAAPRPKRCAPPGYAYAAKWWRCRSPACKGGTGLLKLDGDKRWRCDNCSWLCVLPGRKSANQKELDRLMSIKEQVDLLFFDEARFKALPERSTRGVPLSKMRVRDILQWGRENGSKPLPAELSEGFPFPHDPDAFTVPGGSEFSGYFCLPCSTDPEIGDTRLDPHWLTCSYNADTDRDGCGRQLQWNGDAAAERRKWLFLEVTAD